MSTHVGAAQPFLDAAKDRRSFYQISKDSTIPDDRIVEIVKHAVLYAPSSFNSQTTRAVVLLNEKHDRLWEITADVLRAMLSPDRFETTAKKLEGFKAGHGTVLFFEDGDSVRAMSEKFVSYAERFGPWSIQTSGMAQFIVWTALEKEGMGCNLQHYNPLIDEKVKAEFSVPESWNLISQLVFGKPTGQPGEKSFIDIDERVKVIGGESKL